MPLVADLLADYRARHPDKLAIVDVDQEKSISFGALEAATTDIAAALKERGVAKGSRVLLLAEENLEKLLLWLGIWRLGAVVAPLNVELNAAFIADLAATISPALTLVHKDLDGNALLQGKPFVRFGDFPAKPSGRDPQDSFFCAMRRGVTPRNIPERNDAADLACIFCTSGTTSRPKLVVYDHCAYWLNGLSTLECLGLSADDRTLEYRSFGWNSAQVLSLMPFLEKGLTLHIARRFSQSRFFEWIERYGITFAAGVPTVINMLLNREPDHAALKVPSCLRLMTCSTAPLTLEQWRRFEDMYGVKLLQMYGMSEAGWLAGNRHYRNKLGTVGLPAAASGARDRRQRRQAMPTRTSRAKSQLVVRTVRSDICVTDGTIEPIRGKRIKSGDLAVMDEDGFIHVIGRTKDLIIRGGINIAPLEIDQVLLRHPGILDAAAVGVPDPIQGEEVICYVVPRPGTELTATAVAEHCRGCLPVQKTPKQVLIVSESPKERPRQGAPG